MISKSFDELVRMGYNKFKNITCIYEKIDGIYIGKTFDEFYSDVRSLSKKLLDMGLQGKSIMLYGKNSYNWMVAFLAITAYVGIAVPIDKQWKRNDVNNVLSAMNIDFIFYSGSIGENLTDTNTPKVNFENDTTELIIQGG